MDFFKLTGPEFLEFYWKAFFAVIFLAVLLPYLFRGPFDLPSYMSAAAHKLHPFDIAYLKGGKASAIKAALVSLWHRGLVRVPGGSRILERTAAPLPAGLHPLESSIHEAMDVRRWPRELMKLPLPEMAFSVKALLDQRLILTTSQRIACGAMRIVPPAALLTIGVMRFVRGVALGRPVGFLLGWLIVTGVLFFLCIANLPRRTRRGDMVLSLLGKERVALKSANAKDRNGMHPADLAMGMALFGMTAVPATSGLRDVFKPEPSVSMSSGGGCSSSCGGSSCGGGGCGGGGCGGGGCGG